MASVHDRAEVAQRSAKTPGVSGGEEFFTVEFVQAPAQFQLLMKRSSRRRLCLRGSSSGVGFSMIVTSAAHGVARGVDDDVVVPRGDTALEVTVAPMGQVMGAA